MSLDQESAWRAVLLLKQHYRNGGGGTRVTVRFEGPSPAVTTSEGSDALSVAADGAWRGASAVDDEVAQIFDLYLPLCLASGGRMEVIGHLGQSLDGRIATASGSSRYVNGSANLLHLHRLRALADAVLVGAGTVRHDDPQLTVRLCPGRSPLRVVIDTNRSLSSDHRLFRDGAAPTLVVCAEDRVNGERSVGGAELVGLPRRGDWIDLGALLAELGARGVRVLLVEGGGVTVSRFLAERALTRLQVTVAPVIIGSGRPGIALPAIERMEEALRPPTRRFVLGEDVLFECIFADG